MKVLINNAHVEGVGGGGYWTAQIIKAVSGFCEVDLMNSQSDLRIEDNPDLSVKCGGYDKDKDYDHFIDISHFQSSVCDKARKNIKVCYFPLIKHMSSMYDEIVTLSDYSAYHIKAYWKREAKICKPYSKNLTPGVKKDRTIAVVGNMFWEEDGHSKNQHYLIDTFKALGAGWHMDIIGAAITPEYVNNLKDLAKGQDIDFHISCSDEVKEGILAQAKYFWHANGWGRSMPEQSEHYGIAPEEAIKSGCLTYVHRSGGAAYFCSSWSSKEELIRMTLNDEPNPEKQDFSSHSKMVEFWKELLV